MEERMLEKTPDYFNVTDIFGENVFNDSVMQERLPKKVYKKLREVIEEGKELDFETADAVSYTHLDVYKRQVLMDETVDLNAIALATSGAVGSDLANMINEAAINAVKHGRKYVSQADLFESVEVVIAGKEKKDRIMGPKEKKIVAYHEVDVYKRQGLYRGSCVTVIKKIKRSE